MLFRNDMKTFKIRTQSLMCSNVGGGQLYEAPPLDLPPGVIPAPPLSSPGRLGECRHLCPLGRGQVPLGQS